MIVVAGLALALVVLALMGASRDVPSEQIVLRLARERDPRVIAAAADVLAGRGMTRTAEALRARAQAMPGTATTAGEEMAVVHSPLAGVSAKAWTAFVRAMGTDAPDARSAGGRLGIFGTHLRLLEQLGCVTSIRPAAGGGIEANWIRPRSEAAFLASAPVQYRVFARNAQMLRDALARRYGNAGIDFGSHRASMSGLIAVAQRLGIAGLERWLASASERQRQRAATARFVATNGLF